MTVHWTSDPHLFHKNVIALCNRPFKSVAEMHTTLWGNWQMRVAPGDTVYVLGDLALPKRQEIEQVLAFYRSLPGEKHLVFGNHDKKLRKVYQDSGVFASCSDLKEIDVNGQRVVMCHFPLLSWNKSYRGSWMLHGHCHGNLKPDPHAKRLDVGVDCHNFTPISFGEVQKIMVKKTFVAVDHHGAD